MHTVSWFEWSSYVKCFVERFLLLLQNINKRRIGYSNWETSFRLIWWKIVKKVQPLCTTFCDYKKIQEREMGLWYCFKIVDNIDKEGKMYVIWLNNSKYRVYTNLWRSFADEIIRKEGVFDKDGNIDVNKYDWKIPIL